MACSVVVGFFSGSGSDLLLVRFTLWYKLTIHQTLCNTRLKTIGNLGLIGRSWMNMVRQCRSKKILCVHDARSSPPPSSMIYTPPLHIKIWQQGFRNHTPNNFVRTFITRSETQKLYKYHQQKINFQINQWISIDVESPKLEIKMRI